MSLFLPPTAGNPAEWIRKAAGVVNGLLGRVAALEVSPFRMLATAPAAPVEGEVYYDTVLHVARAWDGTVWRDFW